MLYYTSGDEEMANCQKAFLKRIQNPMNLQTIKSEKPNASLERIKKKLREFQMLRYLKSKNHKVIEHINSFRILA